MFCIKPFSELFCFINKLVILRINKNQEYSRIDKNNGSIQLHIRITNTVHFRFETSNGIKRTEQGSLKPGGGPDNDQLLNVNGDFSFTFPDGTPFSVKFVATEDGYRPQVVIGQGRSGRK